jgi:hypothetical protein
LDKRSDRLAVTFITPPPQCTSCSRTLDPHSYETAEQVGKSERVRCCRATRMGSWGRPGSNSTILIASWARRGRYWYNLLGVRFGSLHVNLGVHLIFYMGCRL